MNDHPNTERPIQGKLILAVIVLITAVYICSIYANLSFAITSWADYRYFPPFERGVNRNMNHHLGAEYLNIARAMVAGQGFANPFYDSTGPTAWMPPVLPTILAGLLWICGGDVDAVMTVIVFFQVNMLILTGLLVLALAQRTAGLLGPGTAAIVFIFAILLDFHLCFQFTHDCWLILLALDLVVAGICWLRPLERWRTALTHLDQVIPTSPRSRLQKCGLVGQDDFSPFLAKTAAIRGSPSDGPRILACGLDSIHLKPPSSGNQVGVGCGVRFSIHHGRLPGLVRRGSLGILNLDHAVADIINECGHCSAREGALQPRPVKLGFWNRSLGLVSTSQAQQAGCCTQNSLEPVPP